MSEEFARADESLIGRVIGGKFAIRRCVGVGASGAVYEADQLVLGRTVAIKILRPELAADARFVNRFQDEALAASRLNHPNTVSVIDYGQTEDGLLYLVMEFLRGHTLTHILQSQILGPTRIADILWQVLSGLEEAHEAGVVHADLKADNIMVERRRNDWDLVKVVDFGIARLLGAPEERPSERTICGTPEYMAPEVIRGVEPTFASDLYAVGVILYELLTGTTPFAGGPPMAVLTKHIREQPEPPSARVTRPIDPLLERISLRALSKRPRDRFASAGEFRAALEPLRTPAAATTEDVLCTSCGVDSSSSFKFCPECGHPRETAQPTRQLSPAELPRRDDALALRDTVDAGEQSTSRDTITTVPATRPLAPVEADHSAAGILPLPLVGREAELNQLIAFLAGATPAAALELVGGEASGKSRLIVDACARAATRGTVVYISSPDPSGLASPYYPIRAMIAGILELPPVCTYEGLGDALEGIGLSRRDLPGLAELFGNSAELSQLEPDVRRREILVSAIRVLQSPAMRSRAALVFEDLERFDRPSLDVVHRLAEGDPQLPLRIVITRANVPAPVAWPGNVSVIEVGSLTDKALDELAAHLASRQRRDPPDAATLRELARGMPGHIHQLVRYMVEGGFADLAPTSLADLIAARLDHLPNDARHVCQIAAVFGTEVGLDVLSAMASTTVSGEQFRAALAVLEARGIVTEQYGVVRFEQHLLRDVVYESTPANVRRGLHRDAGTVLEPMTRDAAVLGHHADLAGKTRRATELLTAAGDSYVRQLDDSGACEMYTRALAAARAVMLSDDDAANREQFVGISVKLADSLRVVGQLTLARGIVSEATEACSEMPLLRLQLVRANAHLQASANDLEAALGSARAAIGAGILLGQPDLLIELYLDLAAMSLRAGQTEIAISELEEALDLITAGEGATTAAGPKELWRLLLRLSQLHASLADAARAAGIAEHAARHAARVGSRVGIARCNALLATQYERIGNSNRAENAQRCAVDQLRQLGDRRGTAELLLSGARPSRTLLRITPWLAREARELAAEVGWDEGVRRASRLDSID